MGHLEDGIWSDDAAFPTESSGRWIRGDAQFRYTDRSPFAAEPGRFHLYLAHACPWCHRAAIARWLQRLEDAITVSFVEPRMLTGGWRFGPAHEEPLYGLSFVHELYQRADSHYSGRCTLPILWDKQRQTILCNESADLLRMLNDAGTGPDLYPEALRAEIDAVNAPIYKSVNNGVYRCGFARTQAAYEEAFTELFATLDAVSGRLRDRQFLVGETLTEADIRLFVTLVRFDAAYVGHFKCNRNRIEDDPVLQGWLERMWRNPAFRDTTRFDEIKTHYYASHLHINPTGVIPLGPRSRLSST